MAKYIWGYVYQEFLDENSTIDVSKTPRFSHDLKIDDEMTFSNALAWYLDTTDEELSKLLTEYDLKIELRDTHPGRSGKRPKNDCDSLVVSDIGTFLTDIVSQPFVHIIFPLSLKKESISELQPV